MAAHSFSSSFRELESRKCFAPSLAFSGRLKTIAKLLTLHSLGPSRQLLSSLLQLELLGRQYFLAQALRHCAVPTKWSGSRRKEALVASCNRSSS